MPYVECLNKNGVTIAMPSGGARNRPSGGFPGGGMPSGMPRPSGSGFPGGGFPGGGFPGGGFPGRIINLSTLNTAAAGPGLTLYCAGTAALEQVTKVAARELGPRGITVNTVSPGATDTDMLHAANTPKASPR
jgi:NAD(P)-dependent dehydrogenase (short-subunit alcohol dehydrogenase family)